MADTLHPAAIIGRVAEVLVGVNAKVQVGDPLFRLDSSEQEAARETAQRQIDETVAETAAAQTGLAAADGQQNGSATKSTEPNLDIYSRF